jgi:hypothetical protein
MERVEILGGHTFVLRTHQLGPEHWSCDVFGRESPNAERFMLEEFGDSELEAIAMALSEAHYHQ